MTVDERVDDHEVPGLAGERTDLAWSRTGLSLTVAAAALVRRVWEVFDTVTPRVAVFSILAAGAVAWAAAMRWGAATAQTTMQGRRVAEERALRNLTYGTTVFAVAALVLSVA